MVGSGFKGFGRLLVYRLLSGFQIEDRATEQPTFQSTRYETYSPHVSAKFRQPQSLDYCCIYESSYTSSLAASRCTRHVFTLTGWNAKSAAVEYKHVLGGCWFGEVGVLL